MSSALESITVVSEEPKDRKKAGRGGRLPQARATPIAVPNHVQAMPIQLVGYVSLIPHGAIDAIALTNSLLVVQCIEPLEIFTGIETANRYVVHDMYLRPLLYCNERSNFIAREFAGNERNFLMDMRDIYGAPFMSATRQNPCCSCTDTLSTQFMNQNIGMMTKNQCDSYFQIYGSGCQTPLVISSPCMAACGGTQRFPVTTGGARVGEIVRLYSGFLQETFTDADTYLVHFPIDLPPLYKLLLISAVFLIDFTYFETNN